MIGSDKYTLSQEAQELFNYTKSIIDNSKYKHITNPCGEASLHSANGNCILSTMIPFFCNNFDEIYHTAKLAARFLIRVNMMDGIYKDEILRTQRIGLGLTGLHEFGWKFFGYGFRDLIDESKSQDFWDCIASIRHTVESAANEYCDELGISHPHTYTVMKPDGSIAKLFALTEGAHLPARKFYIRWVQFQNNDPLLQEYKDNGYPVRECTSYPNVSIVGFPTKPLISSLGMGDKLVLADEATPEEQYKWIMLLEKYWLGENQNGQISYTLKINTDKVSLEEFRKTFLEYQSKIRCCTILPSISDEKLKTMYEYLPEEEVSAYKFNRILSKIKGTKMEYIVSDADMLCAGGACPL